MSWILFHTDIVSLNKGLNLTYSWRDILLWCENISLYSHSSYSTPECSWLKRSRSAQERDGNELVVRDIDPCDITMHVLKCDFKMGFKQMAWVSRGRVGPSQFSLSSQCKTTHQNLQKPQGQRIDFLRKSNVSNVLCCSGQYQCMQHVPWHIVALNNTIVQFCNLVISNLLTSVALWPLWACWVAFVSFVPFGETYHCLLPYLCLVLHRST